MPQFDFIMVVIQRQDFKVSFLQIMRIFSNKEAYFLGSEMNWVVSAFLSFKPA